MGGVGLDAAQNSAPLAPGGQDIDMVQAQRAGGSPWLTTSLGSRPRRLEMVQKGKGTGGRQRR